MSQRIAYDMGFGFDKVMNERGTKRCYPALTKRRIVKQGSGPLAFDEDYCISIESENKPDFKDYHYIGEAAFANGAKRKLQDKDGEVDIEDLRVRIATAIALVNTKGEPAKLAVGLPVSYYEMKSEALSKAIESLRGLNTYITFGGRDNKIPINIESAEVYTQGLGAYYSARYYIDGTPKKNTPKSEEMGLIDIGYRTIDFILMGRGRKGIKLLPDYSGSLEESGMFNVYDRISKQISENHGCEVPLEEIEKAILWYESILNVKGEVLNLSMYENIVYDEIAKEIAGQINIKWKEKKNTLRSIEVTGGGGKNLYANLKKLMPGIVLQEDEIYANCRGFLALQALNGMGVPG